jgi:Family of unknown function (DUF5367)
MNAVQHQPGSSKISRWFGVGFVVWALATIGFRLIGQWFFAPDAALISVAFALFFTPITAWCVRAYITSQSLSQYEGVTFAVCIAAPGMLMDTFTVGFFSSVYPNMNPSVAYIFGAHLLWIYCVCVTSAFFGPLAKPKAA